VPPERDRYDPLVLVAIDENEDPSFESSQTPDKALYRSAGFAAALETESRKFSEPIPEPEPMLNSAESVPVSVF
jgi:hypothetical protein